MADIITNSETLKFDLMFVDEDTRALTLKNPKSQIETSEIEALQTFLRTNNAIIGDRNGATFGKIKQVMRITEQRRQLDFSS